MGVRVYFFVNYQPAMVESDWYKKELHHYVGVCGKTAATGNAAGAWERSGRGWAIPRSWPGSIPRSRSTAMHCAAVRQAGRSRRGRRSRGQDVPGLLNFNPRCQLGPDTSPWEGPIQLTRQFLRRRGRSIPTSPCRSSATGTGCSSSAAPSGGGET